MSLYRFCDTILKSKEVRFDDFEKLLNAIHASALLPGPFKNKRQINEEKLEDITLRNYFKKDGTEVIDFYRSDTEFLIHKKRGYELNISNGKLNSVIPVRAYCLNFLDALFVDINLTFNQYLTKYATSF
ncbi:MAG: hypothetical protein ABIH63_04025 [archaeon]